MIARAKPVAATPLRFTHVGVIVPYVRMTQKSKFADPRAQLYLASKAALQLTVKSQMQVSDWDRWPDKTPFVFRMSLDRPNLYTADLDNMVKAVLDACNKIAFDDDHYCVQILADKRKGVDVCKFIVESVV